MTGRLLGLGGYATSGKDTLARQLANEHGWKHFYMSQYLEQALLRLDPIVDVLYLHGTGYSTISYSDLHADVGYDESKKNLEVRRLLQKLGTEVGRDMFGDSVWIDMVYKAVTPLREAGHDVVITGIRFPNELEALRDHWGAPGWVHREGIEAVNSHASDNSLGPNDFDFVIGNNYDLGYLAGLARDINDYMFVTPEMEMTRWTMEPHYRWFPKELTLNG